MKPVFPSLALAAIATLAAADLPAPVTDADYLPIDRAEAELGQLLFYDPILSGNRTVSCATCHHPALATADGVALSLGDGGVGLGQSRRADPENLPEQRIPRNAPALFNLGAREFTVMFHDGRIEVDPAQPGGMRSPLGEDQTRGFASVLSLQTMFPVLSADEMAGHYGENEISKLVRAGRITGENGAWAAISHRVAALPDYVQRFQAVYPHVTAPEDIAFTDISNAIAAFIAFEWRSDQSPFDAALRGAGDLPEMAAAGRDLFYGKARCAECHSGKFQTDHGFHAMAAPQIGPGKAARFESHARDEGRMRVTGRAEDAFAFRTPSLRNVTETAPYGHAGAHATLAGFLRDHVEPGGNLDSFDAAQVRLPELPVEDFRILSDTAEIDAIKAAKGFAVDLTDTDLQQIEAFLAALTDPEALAGRLGVPDSVPSGLPVDRP
ncbi:cytochrome-c peroxidase [Thalassococcus sp. CAU 1522]|uniref:Cytochrome-c peroxidase n=1 Tax=Thalassococcus arenae TaxID=2851652 RepID=A0ABS6N3S7_9RHOB|nr:cytochrome c peroxidase [Thalassococcus arenae]MBV2358673.1 cytochrome-c peroxidase [Thalassococcus arenae]